MIIGILTVDIEIPSAYSLKDKRRVLNRIRSRVRQKFNVAISEISQQNIWNYACLAAVTVSSHQQHANRVLSKVLELIELLPDCEVADVTMEFL
ncbi:MAG: DUF503 domain-containing protein [Candidatus Pacebacteria bacterium]|nr:DUF503 domain-containing protein [Candidatus Paceibacterota bacterium]